jgi:hypothetical protein
MIVAKQRYNTAALDVPTTTTSTTPSRTDTVAMDFNCDDDEHSDNN